MAKLKPPWVKTDIPKDTKIKLWRIMRDNHTYDAWQQGIARARYEFDESELKYIPYSRDSYKALKDEVMQMPPDEVASLPADLQSWIIHLRPELKGELSQGRIESGFVPTEVKLDHWDRLVRVAERLYLSLGFPSRISAPFPNSRVGGLVSGHWGLEGSQVYFGGEGEGRLSRGLFQHMDYEFSSLTSLDGKELSFSQALKEFKKLVAPLAETGNLEEARTHPLAQSLRDTLDMVIERRHFKGTCEICQDWQ